MNSDGAAGSPGRSALAEPGSDRAIIERVRHGDINAFADLLTRYRAWVFVIVLKHVPADRAEELAHDIFVEAYKALPTYRGTAEFRHWLAGITVRQCFTFWRRASRQPVCCVLNDLSNETQTWLDRASRTESQELFDRQTSRQATRELLAYALERLSAEDRTLVTLLHLEERPVREVARLMAWSPINVKVRAYRARQRMRRIIGQLLKHEEEPRRETQ
ncbi:MAG: RNA polymerase sigma factor [Kiritimatiellae bacterium]|nr:RNA polymerase sigma factor [Verrucomicrobiota bacterium]MCG2660294.1 RNA polymerase sigma factor [Kiritimatiellia bacterium]